MGGMTEQPTAAGEDTRARSIRVDLPVHEVVETASSMFSYGSSVT